MPRVAVVSDTHVPSREAAIPEWVREEVRAADHTLHAGDFDDPDVLDEVRDLAGGDLTAVHGNMDPSSLDLPATAAVELGGVTFALTHGTGPGPMEAYEDRVVEAVRETTDDPDAVGVCGHTHRLLDETVDGVRLLNPGSATGADPAEEATMLRATVADGDLDVEVLRE